MSKTGCYFIRVHYIVLSECVYLQIGKFCWGKKVIQFTDISLNYIKIFVTIWVNRSKLWKVLRRISIIFITEHRGYVWSYRDKYLKNQHDKAMSISKHMTKMVTISNFTGLIYLLILLFVDSKMSYKFNTKVFFQFLKWVIDNHVCFKSHQIKINYYLQTFIRNSNVMAP